jgi:ketosteroid isomerase-like protein
VSAPADVAGRLRSVYQRWAAGDLAVSLERLTARRRGRTLDQTVCVVWRLAGGRCVEMWSHFADQAACDRFWEDEP